MSGDDGEVKGQDAVSPMLVGQSRGVGAGVVRWFMGTLAGLLGGTA